MKKLIFTILSCLLITKFTFALALDNNTIGIRGASMSSAFTGVADDASAIYYNPAGLAMIAGEKLYVEAMGIFAGTNYTADSESFSEELKSTEPATIPGFFISKTFSNFGVGLGVYIPYGGAALKYKDYPVEGMEIYSALGAMAITPAAAMQLMSNLSLGLAVSMYYATMNMKAPYVIPIPVPPYYDMGTSELSLSGLAGYNANIGLMFKATEALNLGLSVKTPAALKVSGKNKVKMSDGTEVASVDTDAKVTMPTYIVLGASDKLVENLLLSLDIWYEMWANTDKMILTAEGTDTEIKTYYKNAIQVNLGAEYQVMPDLTLRGGLQYSQNGTEDKGLSITGIDNDMFSVCLGAGYDIISNLSLNVAGLYTAGTARTYQEVTYNHYVLGLLAGVQAEF